MIITDRFHLGRLELNNNRIFDPNEHVRICEEYLNRSLKSSVRIINAKQLDKSTREAPWCLNVEVNGQPKSYVLRLNPRTGSHEYEALRAMEAVLLPSPRAYGWDPSGEALGVPSFFVDYIQGQSLLKYWLEGEDWAEELYIDTVCSLQAITREELGNASCFENAESAFDVLERSHDYFREKTNRLADEVYEKLKSTMQVFPEPRFSNGDLYAANIIVRDRKLASVIDFEFSGFSDPIYEFLLLFFVCPQLRNRGTEERYCHRMGYDCNSLSWYSALERFETLHFVLKKGQPFEHHTAESLSVELRRWLNT